MIQLQKNLNALIISRMFGVKSNLSETDEFLKANIIPKTLRIDKSGRIKESMTFPAFKFTEIACLSWENSEFREVLESTKYMFSVFKMVNTVFCRNKIMEYSRTRYRIRSKTCLGVNI